MEHVLQIIENKLKLSVSDPEVILKISGDEKIAMADAFFGGSHELVIAGHHYKPNAEFDNELYSSGEMSPEEHYRYIRFTIDAISSIYTQTKRLSVMLLFFKTG